MRQGKEFYNDKTICITGCAGTIGTAFIAFILKEMPGVRKVICLDSAESGIFWLAKHK